MLATGLRVSEACVRHGKGDRARLVRCDAGTAAAPDRYTRAQARHRCAALPWLWIGFRGRVRQPPCTGLRRARRALDRDHRDVVGHVPGQVLQVVWVAREDHAMASGRRLHNHRIHDVSGGGPPAQCPGLASLFIVERLAPAHVESPGKKSLPCRERQPRSCCACTPTRHRRVVRPRSNGGARSEAVQGRPWDGPRYRRGRRRWLSRA